MISTEEQAQRTTRDQLSSVPTSIGALDHVNALSASAEYLCDIVDTLCILADVNGPSEQWTTIASLHRAGLLPRLLRVLIDTSPISQLERLSESDPRPVSHSIIPGFITSEQTYSFYSQL